MIRPVSGALMTSENRWDESIRTNKREGEEEVLKKGGFKSRLTFDDKVHQGGKL